MLASFFKTRSCYFPTLGFPLVHFTPLVLSILRFKTDKEQIAVPAKRMKAIISPEEQRYFFSQGRALMNRTGCVGMIKRLFAIKALTNWKACVQRVFETN